MRVCSDCHTEYNERNEHVCASLGADSGSLASQRAQPSDQAGAPIGPSAFISTAPNVVAAYDPLEVSQELHFHVEKHEDPLIGKIIAGRYRIVDMVGRGGMGVVYKAEHRNIDRLVAIKMLHQGSLVDAETVKRFRNEAQAVSRVEHQHSVRIYDFGVSDQGQPYLVMDFIDGVSLRERLQQQGPLTLSHAEYIFEQVIGALACAHEAGVIHRDLKPANIMLSQHGNKSDWVSVVDFGISTLTANGAQTRERRGSPPYMSPEQCKKGCEVDHRSDIYSLAIVIYESLAGRGPYNSRNALEMLDAHVNVAAIPLRSVHPSLSACEAVSHVLARALEKQPADRFQTIEEFGTELKEAVKRDAIRLNYLTNRKESLLSSTNNLPVLPDVDEYGIEMGGTPVVSMPVYKSDTADGGKDKNLWQSVVHKLTGSVEEEEGEQSKYAFYNCPHCNEPVEEGISFCLACGRSLATTKEFSRIRSAQGVFTLPKSHDTSGTMPAAFSQKTRAVTPDSGVKQRTNKVLLIVSLLILIAIFFLTGMPGLMTRTFSESHSAGR